MSGEEIFILIIVVLLFVYGIVRAIIDFKSFYKYIDKFKDGE